VSEELDQCLHDYALQSDLEAPTRLVLVGERAATPDLAEALGKRLGIRVEPARLPQAVRVAPSAPEAGKLLSQFPVCAGALLVILRRRRGEPTAAPGLRQRLPSLRESVRFRRAAVVAATLAVIVGLAVALFAVRQAQIETATRVQRQSQPLLKEVERLRQEVAILEHEAPLERSVLDVLLALVEVMPQGLKIASITIDPAGKIAIAGNCPSVEEASEKAITALKGSVVFTNPKFLSAAKEREDFKFRITCELRKARPVESADTDAEVAGRGGQSS
jgi:hypothetical protein